MEYFSIIISILAGVFAYFALFGETKEIGDRLISSFGPPILFWLLIPLPASLIMKHVNFNDEEYRSYYAIKIVHEDAWDEWIKRTCTRTHRTANGHTYTTNYDCSYRKYHPDIWYIVGNDGDKTSINQDEYDSIRKEWGVPEVFVDMKRKYYRLDGDAQEYVWDNNWKTGRYWTVVKKYENRIKGSESILKGEHITEEGARTLGLYEYSKVPIIGFNDDIGKKRIEYINSYYGTSKQIHIFLLVWDSNKYSPDISEDQKAYWEGGNMNELVICLGVNNSIVRWSNSFSWQENQELDVRVKNYFIEHDSLDIERFSYYLENSLNLWHRRDFEKDFNYIQPFLSTSQLLWVYILAILSSFGSVIGMYYLWKQNKY